MIPKFRAWGRDDNYPGTPSDKFEMFYDVSVVTTYNDKRQHVIADFEMYGKPEYSGTEIIDYTLMEYIGVVDKNGKEVYESDIFKIHSGKHSGELLLVEFNHGICEPVYYYTSDSFEVVGNIYENPELLERVE